MTDKFDAYAHSMLHGKGHDRWFDKSFNIIVSKNGVVSQLLNEKFRGIYPFSSRLGWTQC